MTREKMEFPNTFDEFVKSYGFKDNKEVYTNGSELIPVFRVKQWLDHIEPCEDAVSRQAVLELVSDYDLSMGQVVRNIHALPPVTSKPYDEVLNKIKAEFKSKADGDDWYHTTDGLVWEEAIEIIDKHRGEQK